MAEKVTTMVLKVDLQCSRCYKKVKKVLCKFPQIRNQIYDEKANTVTITVVCCSPEKIRDKLCYKGGGSIKSIEIKPPPKPKEPEKKPEKPKESEKPKEPEKKPENPKEPEKKPEKNKQPEKQPEKPTESEKPKGPGKPKEAEKPKEAPAPAPLPPMAYNVGFSYPERYHGHGGGPGYFGGPPPPSFPCYGTPVYDSWGGGGGYRYGYASRGDCLSEENPQACSIM